VYQPQSPFPFTMKTGAIITDERCKCGALRSQHAHTIAYGHGASLVAGLGKYEACERFTWIAWVFTSMNVPNGFVALDDRHIVKVERANKRAVGAKGYRYEVRDMGAGKLVKRLFTCAHPKARSKNDAIEHARTELRLYLERRASMTVLDGGLVENGGAQ
jgi:hypothetical protein